MTCFSYWSIKDTHHHKSKIGEDCSFLPVLSSLQSSNPEVPVLWPGWKEEQSSPTFEFWWCISLVVHSYKVDVLHYFCPDDDCSEHSAILKWYRSTFFLFMQEPTEKSPLLFCFVMFCNWTSVITATTIIFICVCMAWKQHSYNTDIY